MEQKKSSQIEPVSLEVGDMHGPITTKVDIFVKMPEGRVARLTTRMAIGVVPTRAEINAVMAAAMTPESIKASSIPAGTRLLTKKEFVAHMLRSEGSDEIPMPGDQVFVAVPGDVEKSMLVHAILGVDIEADMELGTAAELVNEYAERGLMTIDRTPNEQGKVAIAWDDGKLAELPEGVLRAIYERVTA